LVLSNYTKEKLSKFKWYFFPFKYLIFLWKTTYYFVSLLK
jgi:hypothetical protein